MVAFCHEAHSRDAVRDCLKTNWESLSEECKTAIEAVMQAQNAGATDPSVGADSNNDGTVTNVEKEFEHPQRPRKPSDLPLIEVQPHITQEQYDEIALGQRSDSNLKGWLMRLWWVYPVGLVLFIQVLACVRIRQIRRIEASYH
jgi:hypothetical protein